MAAPDGTTTDRTGTAAAAVPSLEELFDLHGRVAVVTGAGSGIGRAVVRRLALCGARVLATDLTEDAAAATVDEVERLGGEARALDADVRRPEDADRTAAAALDAWGRLDVLVNNAGIYPAAAVLDAPPELWDDVLRVNTIGVFLTSRACARAMAGGAPGAPGAPGGGGGAIVNLASKSAFQPTRGMAHYAASKGGVAMLTKALALELAPLGIRVERGGPRGDPHRGQRPSRRRPRRRHPLGRRRRGGLPAALPPRAGG